MGWELGWVKRFGKSDCFSLLNRLTIQQDTLYTPSSTKKFYNPKPCGRQSFPFPCCIADAIWLATCWTNFTCFSSVHSMCVWIAWAQKIVQIHFTEERCLIIVAEFLLDTVTFLVRHLELPMVWWRCPDPQGQQWSGKVKAMHGNCLTYMSVIS